MPCYVFEEFQFFFSLVKWGWCTLHMHTRCIQKEQHIEKCRAVPFMFIRIMYSLCVVHVLNVCQNETHELSQCYNTFLRKKETTKYYTKVGKRFAILTFRFVSHKRLKITINNQTHHELNSNSNGNSSSGIGSCNST